MSSFRKNLSDDEGDSLEHSIPDKKAKQKDLFNENEEGNASLNSSHSVSNAQHAIDNDNKQGGSKIFIPSFISASPPKIVSFDEVMKAATGVSNMVLAHNIATSDDFRMEKPELPEDSFEKKVRNIVEKAFWDMVDEKLKEEPPDYSYALQFFSDLKQNLFDIFLPSQEKYRTLINETLDIDLIKQQAEHGVLDFHHYANIVISIMAKCCAPARDDEVAKLKTITEIVPLYREIFHVLDHMKLDLANFIVEQMKPYIKQEAVEYEQLKFNEFLKTQAENNIDGLEYTKAWLKRNHQKLLESSSFEGNSSSASATESQWSRIMSPNSVLASAFMELLDWDTSQILPETIAMDGPTCYMLSEQIRRLIFVSTLITITTNIVGSSIAELKTLKESLKKNILIISSDTPMVDVQKISGNIAEQIIVDVNSALADIGREVLSNTQTQILKNQIEEAANTSHPVHSLLRKRVMEFVHQLILKSSFTNVVLPSGFSTVSNELCNICGQLLKILSHNKAVFGLHYANIISTF